MIRQTSLEEISDGKLYGLNDMVKADCQDCRGCSSCCRGMGKSIILDPLDVFRLEAGLNQSFEALLAEDVELSVVDGLILPNLKMTGAQEACPFLDDGGRCGIHQFRPGICRLFPLGRYYSDGGFRYFLQIHECRRENRTKVKVKKWIDTPEPNRYEDYINAWHSFIRLRQEQADGGRDGEAAKAASMEVLTEFYIRPYDRAVDFYVQFYDRLGYSHH